MSGTVKQELALRDQGDKAGGLDGDVRIGRAKRQLRRQMAREATFRERYLNDMRFYYGDAENNWQWPEGVRNQRAGKHKPCLTFPIIRQNVLQIINEAKQARVSMGVKPVGGGASKESADMMMEVIRHIEYQSRAQDKVYKPARMTQVAGGKGYWRLHCDYFDNEDGEEQEIRLLPVKDPLAVYLDTSGKDPNGLEANYGFILDSWPLDLFADTFPDFAGQLSDNPLGLNMLSGYQDKDSVAICEYFYKEFEQDQAITFTDPTSRKRKTARRSLLPASVFKELKATPGVVARDISIPKIKWCFIVGDTVVKERDWPGRFIPIIKLVGEEVEIGGEYDCKGHVRASKDAQRMYNYNASGQVEVVALQTKTPWIAAAKAIEGHEKMWATANTEDHAALIYNHMGDDGNEIPAPQRAEPPTPSAAFQSGMDTAFNQMMMTSGQWQNQMGMQGNERTGAAIEARQGQGDTATAHYQDEYEAALQATAIQIIDLVPRIYDTERVLLMQADDQSEYDLHIDPAAQQAYQVLQARDGEAVKRIFNPAIGKYEIQSRPGKDSGTKRKDTQEAMTLLLTQNPGLTGLIGDLLLKTMDFAEAEEAAARLRRMVPGQALGTGPTQQEQLLQQQVASLQEALQKSLNDAAKTKIKLAGKAEMRDIDVFKAQTDRIKVLKDQIGQDGEAIAELVHQLVQEALGNTGMDDIVANNAGAIEAQSGGEGLLPPTVGEASPPVPGARQGNDGKFYLIDPSRPGKYNRIEGLVQQGGIPRV